MSAITKLIAMPMQCSLEVKNFPHFLVLQFGTKNLVWNRSKRFLEQNYIKYEFVTGLLQDFYKIIGCEQNNDGGSDESSDETTACDGKY